MSLLATRFPALALALLCAPCLARESPNFVVIFADDLGYGDLGCYGNRHIRTPNLDRMASEGIRLTSFYAQNVCGPSRAALLTGCYPIRLAEPGNTKGAHTILHPREQTIAEVLASKGYVTGLVGKWHVAGPGAHERGRGTGPYKSELMPNRQGFDYFFGTPAHNGFTREVDTKSWRTELMRNDEVLESPTDLNLLTHRYTGEAIRFVERNREQPFFLYSAHTMPHVPLGASADFRGRSPRGLYGDVIEELDWSVGEILSALRELRLDRKTLVVFTSDNGPWIESHLGDHGGSAAPLRGFKMTTWEGGAACSGDLPMARQDSLRPGQRPTGDHSRPAAHLRGHRRSSVAARPGDRRPRPLALACGRNRPEPARELLLLRVHAPPSGAGQAMEARAQAAR